jgi:phosphoglycolate phosphatase
MSPLRRLRPDISASQEPPAGLQQSVTTSSAAAEYIAFATTEGRVAVRPDVRWDAYDAYLFDIDGTLLRDPGRVHYQAFSKACMAVLGHPLSLETISVQGSTDPRILRDAFAAAGIADETWRPHHSVLLETICSVVARDAAQMQLRVMPGVVDVLAHLARADKCLGVASGNLESIGWLKLQMAGLREWFRFGSFSDAHEERDAMIAAAAEAARALAGKDAALVVVGDTPADIAAARANDIPVIAVATGHSSFNRLMEFIPDICAENLSALLLAGELA